MASEWNWNTHTPSESEDYEVSVCYDSGGSTSTSERPQEFDRFAELTSKLIVVPKSEIDAQRKKS